MVLKLYGSPVSTCTKRVATVLIELNVPFELVPIDLRKGEQKTPQFLEKQPFGKVPYIDDDGFILYESRAISRYLATKYSGQGTQLIPKDLQAWAKFEQAASVEICNFDPYASGVVIEKYFKPIFGQTPDEAQAKDLTEKLNANLDTYDLILSKQKFLGGDVSRELNVLASKPLPQYIKLGIHSSRPFPSPLRRAVASVWCECLTGEAKCQQVVRSYLFSPILASCQRRGEKHRLINWGEQ
ncbi:hypothetical protein PTI98_011385 [Pleurotus ostreatus]|nr:hypothetical protein PTI98_011385 [Pleurotus ostreatus]